MLPDDFLRDLSLRRIAAPTGWPFGAPMLAVGRGASALEVVVAEATTAPSEATLRTAWRKRWDGRAAPVLLVLLYGGKASVCGPSGDQPPVLRGLEAQQVEQLSREALAAPDRHAAIRSVRAGLEALGTAIPGVRNEGLLATHVLKTGAQSLPEWQSACGQAIALRGAENEALLRGLGFTIARHDNQTAILEVGDRRRAVAVLLEAAEAPEQELQRFSGQSPITYALAVADRLNLPWVLLLQGAKLRLYPARSGVGIAQRGRTETFVEIHSGLLDARHAGLLWLLFSAAALADGGSLDTLLLESRRFSGSLAESLRERIYNQVIPDLAEGIAAARALDRPTPADLAETYEMAVLILFRLLFIAYAEDKDLLPYRWNEAYQKRSLKGLAGDLLDLRRKHATFDPGMSMWDDVRSLFRAVERGQKEWGVPAYGGSLFASDAAVSRLGAELDRLSLSNPVFGPVLSGLLLTDTPEGPGPVDFRSLGVREFGTIYEGLLESELSVAEVDLAATPEGGLRPAKKTEAPEIRRGNVYLHNRSGLRKATGSFYTKSFAVEHLLERALEPALDEHLERLRALDNTDAAERFFDFRVADIAMGSGHFLVAAIDRIGNRLSSALEERRLPGVVEELEKLRAAALQGLGDLANQYEMRPEQLLRRLIARRCIYGVDLNPVAVDLARVSVWIHTFVPGLPLTLLERNLVRGNSLVGIGRLEEVKEKLEERGLPLFPLDAAHLLGAAAEPLKRLAKLADATPTDLERARRAHEAARAAVAPTAALCDIVTAARLAGKVVDIDLDNWEETRDRLPNSLDLKAARGQLAGLAPFHFPIAFPEVFLRERPGFDVIVGNPPWQEATLEEDAFWARHAPGLRALPQREQEAEKARLRRDRPDLVAAYERELAEAALLRQALTAGQYPGMGTGDPDLYKAFCWRFWNLVCADGGRVGVVLPRSALAAKGSTEFRREVFTRAERVDVTMLLNNRQWFFEEVHPQYTIGLIALARRQAERTQVALRGPYPNLQRYQAGIALKPAVFSGDEIQTWNDTASLPLLPTEESLEVFTQLRKAPRLDLDDGKSWRARPHSELHATNDKGLMDVNSEDCPKGFWPVFKGESFDLWTPDTGTYYAWADPKNVLPHLQAKRLRGGRNRKSPFSEFDPRVLRDPKTLPCLRPRIAFRDITNRTNQRTVIVALVPPEVFTGNQAAYLLWPRGDARDEAYLLGVLSSLPLDWYARRFVETHLNFFVFNPLPVSRPSADDPLRRRAIELAGQLAAPDERFADWAGEVGVACGPLAPDEKEDMIHELDAVVAHLYGLSEKHLIHIFETFHEGWHYEMRLHATLRHFREWKRRATP